MRRLPKLALSLALVLSLGIVGTVGCSSGGSDEKEPATTATESAEKEEDVVLTDDDVTEFDVDEDEAEVETEAVDESEDDSEVEVGTVSDEETKHVGAAGVGFVDIPESWTEFKDAEGGTDLQWCDGTPYTIVTLNVIDLSEALSEEERKDFTIEVALNNIANHLLEEGMDEESITGAHVTLAGRDAVQVYGMFPEEGAMLVVWLVEDDAGNYRYVSAEGTTETILDSVAIVEGSYTL